MNPLIKDGFDLGGLGGGGGGNVVIIFTFPYFLNPVVCILKCRLLLNLCHVVSIQKVSMSSKMYHSKQISQIHMRLFS